MSGLEILFEEHLRFPVLTQRINHQTLLEHMGMQIFYGQKASNIIEGIDLIVHRSDRR